MSRKSSSRKARRDTSDIASRRLHSPVKTPNSFVPYNSNPFHLINPSTGEFRTLSQNKYLQQFEDRRRWHPLGSNRPAASFNRPNHTLTLSRPTKPFKRKDGTLTTVGFNLPQKVLICVRRKIRRELMHALGISGRGGPKKKRPKYNKYSKVRC